MTYAAQPSLSSALGLKLHDDTEFEITHFLSINDITALFFTSKPASAFVKRFLQTTRTLRLQGDPDKFDNHILGLLVHACRSLTTLFLPTGSGVLYRERTMALVLKLLTNNQPSLRAVQGRYCLSAAHLSALTRCVNLLAFEIPHTGGREPLLPTSCVVHLTPDALPNLHTISLVCRWDRRPYDLGFAPETALEVLQRGLFVVLLRAKICLHRVRLDDDEAVFRHARNGRRAVLSSPSLAAHAPSRVLRAVGIGAG